MAVTPVLDVREMSQWVDVGRFRKQSCGLVALRKCTATDAVDSPRFAFLGLELHAVGMEIQESVGTPDNLYRGRGLEHVLNGSVGHVSFARSCQTAIERHTEVPGIRMLGKIELGRFLRAHGVAGRRAFADAV